MRFLTGLAKMLLAIANDCPSEPLHRWIAGKDNHRPDPERDMESAMHSKENEGTLRAYGGGNTGSDPRRNLVFVQSTVRHYSLANTLQHLSRYLDDTNAFRYPSDALINPSNEQKKQEGIFGTKRAVIRVPMNISRWIGGAGSRLPYPLFFHCFHAMPTWPLS